MKAEDTVRKTIKEHDLIPEGSRLVLGLSGGPDSLCLLHILSGLQDEFCFRLEALHLNHLMRGEDASADVEFLKQECSRLNVPLTVAECDVYKKAEDEGICVEEAGRSARHSALRECAGADLIVFAHNKNDQAETVLMRIIRGTGVHGLAAMEYKREDGVIRPLLDTPRALIEEYCAQNGLKPRFDSTNASMEYLRNRLRLQLIPQLEKEYNPNLKEGLARLSKNAAEDDDYLSREAKKFVSEMQKPCAEYGDQAAAYTVKELQKLHPAIFKRAVRLIFYELGLTEDIASVHLNSLMAAVAKNRGGAVIQFPMGYEAEFRHGIVLFKGPEK